MIKRLLRTVIMNPKTRNLVRRAREYRRRRIEREHYNEIRQNYYQNIKYKYVDDTKYKVSIVVPCYNTPERYFESLIASVFSQSYQNWELIVIDGSNDTVCSSHLENRAKSDTRIVYKKVENKGIASNTNEGIKIATGNLIAFLDHDDSLDPNALAESVSLFIREPDLGMVYSDEDKISEDSERYFGPHFKPDFSIDLLRNVNYITHFVVVKTEVAQSVGGIRHGFEGAQDYDFLLRVIDTGCKVGHVPQILYHWREAIGSTAANFDNKPQIKIAGVRALEEHYARNKTKHVTVTAIPQRPGFYRASYDMPDTESKLKIYINRQFMQLSERDYEYLLAKYRINKDVKKYQINITDKKSDIHDDDICMTINAPIIPSRIDSDIISLFSLCEDITVAAVSPKITYAGRIYEMGKVYAEGMIQPLFNGVDPAKDTPFGSTEWVRNTDDKSSYVYVERVLRKRTKKPDETKRYITWSHTEFTMLVDPQLSTSIQKRVSFYNPNITELIELKTRLPMKLSDYVEPNHGS